MISKNKSIFSLLIAIMFNLIGTKDVFGQIIKDFETVPTRKSNEDLPLCSPGVYLIIPIDCLPLGPSANLTYWARKGISFPIKPLPANHPKSELMELDKKYAKLNIPPGAQASYYPNLESAIKGIGKLRSIPPGDSLYISYENETYYNGNPYLVNGLGEWIRASPSNPSTFQGLLFEKPPQNDFGWIIDAVNPYQSPSFNAPVSKIKLNREEVVQVFDKIEKEGTVWYMIEPGQWVDRKKIGVVSSKISAPDGINLDRWIEVNLYEQTLSVYDNNKLIFATLVSTGFEPYFTKPGLFQINEKKKFETMTGAFAPGKVDYYLLEDVPWTMYYDGPRALHGAYWRAIFGYEQSHGCVNLSVGDAHWLFNWASEDEWVYVWDPSGQTPTDPEFYQSGIAF